MHRHVPDREASVVEREGDDRALARAKLHLGEGLQLLGRLAGGVRELKVAEIER